MPLERPPCKIAARSVDTDGCIRYQDQAPTDQPRGDIANRPMGLPEMLTTAPAGAQPWRPFLTSKARVDTAILEALDAFGDDGLTTQEVMTLIDERRTTASAHIRNLILRRLVRPTGRAVASASATSGGALKYRASTADEIEVEAPIARPRR